MCRLAGIDGEAFSASRMTEDELELKQPRMSEFEWGQILLNREQIWVLNVIFSCFQLCCTDENIFQALYSVLICNNYECYKLYRIYLYNFTQVRSSYALKSHKYYIHHSNIIILGTRESEKKIRGEVRLEFFRGKIPSSEASSFPDTWRRMSAMVSKSKFLA